MKTTLHLTIACLKMALAESNAAVVIDSFALGEHVLQTGGQSQSITNFPGPIGNRRITVIPTREVPLGATMTSTLDTTLGQVSFLVNTAGITTRFPLDLTINYTGGGTGGTGPYSLIGYNAFVFSFSQVLGTGSLIVELGSGSASYGPEVTRVPITAPGDILFPFSGITHASNGDLDNFVHMHFVFEPVTPQFGFTLNEVTVVPEPTSMALLGAALLLGVTRRRNSSAPEGCRKLAGGVSHRKLSPTH